jgi:hypothetical protein
MLAKISSAVLTQTNGRGLALLMSTKPRIAAISNRTLR